MSQRLLLTLVACALLAACELKNPCQAGTMRGQGGRCVPAPSGEDEEEPADVDAGEGDAGDDTSLDDAPDAAAEDSSTEPNDGSQMDAAASDASWADASDSAPVPGTDAEAGADGEGPPVEPDAEAVPDASGPTLCPGEARSTWRQFQRSEQLVPAIAACYRADPLCASGQCNMTPCLQSAAAVVGCDACATSEVACAAEHCAVACSLQTDDDACRACACRSGCMSAPSGCGSEMEACADCVGAGCSTRIASLSDIITVPLSFVLLHDRVDPASGLPAYALSSGEQETMLDIDAQLIAINDMLAAARPDHRQLRLIRAAAYYAPAPASGVCPDPVKETDTRRMFGALNVVLTAPTPACPAAATSAFAGRTSASTLQRVIGNMLGIAPADQAGESWQITSAQLVRMHNYARWRLGAADAVREAERATSTGFVYGPVDPIWDKLTTRDWALTNASVFTATAAGPFELTASAGVQETFPVPANRAARRALGVRFSAKVIGTPSDDLLVNVSSSHNTMKLGRSALKVGNGMIVADEAYASSSDVTPSWLRNHYGAGTWTISITDSANLTISDVRLEIVLGDRSFIHYDRHARGVQDLMVYRPSTSELLTAPNSASWLAFGAITSDPVPALPEADANVILGDVDGDGAVDLLARKGATLWVSFFRHVFTAWRPGSISGSNRPIQSDEVLLGDIDGDGFGDLFRRRHDFAVGRSTWAYHRGVGDGSFEAAASAIDLVPDDHTMNWTLGAVGRQNHSDIYFMDTPSQRIHIRYNITPPPTTSGVTPKFYGGWIPSIGTDNGALLPTDRIRFLDTNQDFIEDVVGYRPSSGEWLVHLNQGSERFGPQKRLSVPDSKNAFKEGDVFLGTAP